MGNARASGNANKPPRKVPGSMENENPSSISCDPQAFPSLMDRIPRHTPLPTPTGFYSAARSQDRPWGGEYSRGVVSENISGQLATIQTLKGSGSRRTAPHKPSRSGILWPQGNQVLPGEHRPAPDPPLLTATGEGQDERKRKPNAGTPQGCQKTNRGVTLARNATSTPAGERQS